MSTIKVRIIQEEMGSWVRNVYLFNLYVEIWFTTHYLRKWPHLEMGGSFCTLSYKKDIDVVNNSRGLLFSPPDCSHTLWQFFLDRSPFWLARIRLCKRHILLITGSFSLMDNLPKVSPLFSLGSLSSSLQCR